MDGDLLTAYLLTPIGALALRGTADALHAIDFLDESPAVLPEVPAPLRAAVDQLAAYFRGERRTFDLALDPHGTPFQQRVWAEVLRIPYGQTTTYGAIAHALGDPKTVRAVGAANGANPLPIVVPCHRVIGSGGELIGYGGGLWRKEWLLKHEGRPVQNRLFE